MTIVFIFYNLLKLICITCFLCCLPGLVLLVPHAAGASEPAAKTQKSVSGPAVKASVDTRFDTPFKQIVYGRYVASFRDRPRAEAEAEGLTRMGWPASVREERVQDVMWFRVYLLPPGARETAGNPISGFEIALDMSDTDKAAKKPVSCPDYDRLRARIELALKINAAIPNRPYLAGLRVVGHDWPSTFSAVDRSVRDSVRRLTDDRPPARSRLVWGLLAYDRTAYSQAVRRIEAYAHRDPLEDAANAADEDLAILTGRKILIVISDFKKLDLSDIQWKNKPSPCVFAVAFDADEKGRQAAEAFSKSTGCGNGYDGCRLLADTRYFNQFIQDVFGDSSSGNARPAGSSGCSGPDRDGDGVCDEADQCPNTPKGALVDDRGCWMAALGPFFEFDRADVRPEFLPGLEWAADILKDNPGLVVEVAGHADNVGTEAYNRNLGLRRAQAVKNVLVNLDVKAARLQVRSYGESRPLADNGTDVGRARNRRVELHVLNAK